MSFKAGYIFTEGIVPVKLYEHSSLESELGLPYTREDYEALLLPRIQKSKGKSYLSGIDYAIAIAWANKKDNPLIDFIQYRLGDSDNWKSNASMSGWLIEKGVWINDPEKTCEEGVRVLGDEVTLRRSLSKEEYFRTLVNFKRINEELVFG